jgi:hypothetical protein
VPGYDAELMAAITRLAELARAKHRQELAHRLDVLEQDMNAELAS